MYCSLFVFKNCSRSHLKSFVRIISKKNHCNCITVKSITALCPKYNPTKYVSRASRLIFHAALSLTFPLRTIEEIELN